MPIRNFASSFALMNLQIIGSTLDPGNYEYDVEYLKEFGNFYIE